MQLDQTNIAIRERGFLEILDLALVVVRHYGRPLLFYWALAAAPLMVINYFLLQWLPSDFDDRQLLFGYLNTMVLLVAVQAPLVSIFMTVFLGRAVFKSPLATLELFRVARQSLSPLLWCVLILRAIVVSWALIYLARNATDYTGVYLLLLLVAAYAVGLRAIRPYILEIILLERNPLRVRRDGEMTVAQRSRALHAPNAGDLLGRWLGTAGIAAALVGSLVGTAWFFSGMVLLDWNWGPAMLHVVIPGVLWMVAGFCAIVRFLSYLDLRIRCEGWEVALLCRAAAETV